MGDFDDLGPVVKKASDPITRLDMRLQSRGNTSGTVLELAIGTLHTIDGDRDIVRGQSGGSPPNTPWIATSCGTSPRTRKAHSSSSSTTSTASTTPSRPAASTTFPASRRRSPISSRRSPATRQPIRPTSTRCLSALQIPILLAIGFRVRSAAAVRFRQWAADKLKEYIVKGFVLDDERLKRADRRADYFDEPELAWEDLARARCPHVGPRRFASRRFAALTPASLRLESQCGSPGELPLLEGVPMISSNDHDRSHVRSASQTSALAPPLHPYCRGLPGRGSPGAVAKRLNSTPVEALPPAYLQMQPLREQQSSLQLEQVSLPLQLPSPQEGGHTPQSPGQLAQVSPPLQLPSPQTIHGPQSLGQLAQVSPPLQLPSPQTIHGPQSLGQLAQVSPPLQVPLPQMGVNVDVTEVAEVTVTVHVPVPLQPPPLQPLKVEPADGDAVSVIMVP